MGSVLRANPNSPIGGTDISRFLSTVFVILHACI